MQDQSKKKKTDSNSTAATETAGLSNDKKLVTAFKVEGAGGIGGTIDRYVVISDEKSQSTFKLSVEDVISEEIGLIVGFYQSNRCLPYQRYDVAIAISDICERLKIHCPIEMQEAEVHKVDDSVRIRRSRQGPALTDVATTTKPKKDKKGKKGTRAYETVNYKPH